MYVFVPNHKLYICSKNFTNVKANSVDFSVHFSFLKKIFLNFSWKLKVSTSNEVCGWSIVETLKKIGTIVNYDVLKSATIYKTEGAKKQWEKTIKNKLWNMGIIYWELKSQKVQYMIWWTEISGSFFVQVNFFLFYSSSWCKLCPCKT